VDVSIDISKVTVKSVNAEQQVAPTTSASSLLNDTAVAVDVTVVVASQQPQ
jgi:hypothetical protein